MISSLLRTSQEAVPNQNPVGFVTAGGTVRIPIHPQQFLIPNKELEAQLK
jgi:hypothetical protein